MRFYNYTNIVNNSYKTTGYAVTTDGYFSGNPCYANEFGDGTEFNGAAIEVSKYQERFNTYYNSIVNAKDNYDKAVEERDRLKDAYDKLEPSVTAAENDWRAADKKSSDAADAQTAAQTEKDNADKAVSEQQGKVDAAKKAKDAADAELKKYTDKTAAAKAELDKAAEAQKAADQAVTDAKTELTRLQEEVTKAEQGVTDAQTALDQAKDAAKEGTDANKAAKKEFQDKADQAAEALKSAQDDQKAKSDAKKAADKTLDEANTAKQNADDEYKVAVTAADDASKAKDTADQAVTDAQTELDAVNKKYEKVVAANKRLAEASAALTAAQEAEQKAKDEADAAAKALKEAEDAKNAAQATSDALNAITKESLFDEKTDLSKFETLKAKVDAYNEAVKALADVDKVLAEKSDAVKKAQEAADAKDDAYTTAAEALKKAKAEYDKYHILYTMIEGDKATFTKGNTAQFRSSAELAKFAVVYVDDQVVSAENYTTSSGSTIVVLNKDFVSTLDVTGSHRMVIESTDGKAEGIFFVKNPDAPKSSSNAVKQESNVQTCQDVGYPAGYSWNEEQKACVLEAPAASTAYTQPTSVNGIPYTGDHPGFLKWISSLAVSVLAAAYAMNMLRKHR